MKTISFELSKRINELGLLRDVETEYIYHQLPNKDLSKWNKPILKNKKWNNKGRFYKTLTLEEAIEFILKHQITFIHIIMPLTNNNNHTINSIRYFSNSTLGEIFTWGDEDGYTDVELYGKTQIEAIENLITYLLDKNLIGPTNKNL